MLFNEARIYSFLQEAAGFPTLFDASFDPGRAYLALEPLGRSLDSLFDSHERRFSLHTVLMLIPQMLCRIEFVHRKKILHRDLKPADFVMGLGPRSNQLHLIDFGVASGTTTHQNPAEFLGSPHFTSRNAHCGFPLSQRDDLESLGYIFVYLAKGSLPWSKIQVRRDRDECEPIRQLKEALTPAALCADLPPEFAQYMEAVKNLQYGEVPNYAGFRELFRDLFLRLGYQFDGHYEWSAVSARPFVFKSSRPSLTGEVRLSLHGSRAASDPRLLDSARPKPPRKTQGPIASVRRPSPKRLLTGSLNVPV
jgi:serine/threonine protein kinase